MTSSLARATGNSISRQKQDRELAEIEPQLWQRPCVEVASDAGTVLVRDTKDPDGAVLRFPAEALRAFIREQREEAA